jgi:hypothetical protein
MALPRAAQREGDGRLVMDLAAIAAIPAIPNFIQVGL